MLNKVILVLSMSLNLVLSLALVGRENVTLKARDFRDAVSDTRSPGGQLGSSLAGIAPLAAPAVEAPAAEAVADQVPAVLAAVPAPAETEIAVPAKTETPAPAEAIAPAKPAVPALRPVHDWAAYKQDSAGDSDVIISNIFRSKKAGERAMQAAANKCRARGKDVLFSCVLEEKSGGAFYIIRLDQSSVFASNAAVVPSLKNGRKYSGLVSIVEENGEDFDETF